MGREFGFRPFLFCKLAQRVEMGISMTFNCSATVFSRHI